MPRSSATTPRRSIDNLVFNGDFEYAPPFTAATNISGAFIDGTASGSTSNNNLYGWSTITGFGATRTCQFDTSTYHSGTTSMLLSLNNAIADIQVWSGGKATNRTQVENYAIRALPNTSYTVSGWIKVNKSAGTLSDGVHIVGSERDGSGTNTIENATTKLTSTADWTFVTSTFTTGSTTRFIAIKLRIQTTTTATVDAWFDDIKLTKTTPDTRSTSTVPRRSVENLVFNGDFEYAPAFTAATTTSGKFVDGTAGGTSSANNYGWYTSYTNNAAAQFDSTEKYTGNNSFKLSTTAINSVAQVISVQVPNLSSSSYFELLPNTSYTITFRMKTNYVSGDGRGAFLRHTQYTGDKTSSTGTDSTYIKTTTNWTQYSISFTTASTTRFGIIRLFTWGQDAPATLIMDAWFDDIRLTKTTPDTRTAA